jgi:hypothetical protein
MTAAPQSIPGLVRRVTMLLIAVNMVFHRASEAQTGGAS